MEELTTTGVEFYLTLIAKELTGAISETEKSALRQWLETLQDKQQVKSSPLLSLYNVIAG